MRKALIFFVVAVIVFVWRTRLGAWSDDVVINIKEGIVAVAFGLTAVFVPLLLPALRLVSMVVRIPVWITVISLYVFGTSILGLLCLIEILFPFLLGFLVGYMCYLEEISSFWCIIIAIGYLSAWIAFGKWLGKVIANTWNRGTELMSGFPPISVLDDVISKYVLDLNNWIKGKRPN